MEFLLPLALDHPITSWSGWGYRIDDAENRSRRAYPQGERQHRRQSEARTLHQRAQAIVQILSQNSPHVVFHTSRSPTATDSFPIDFGNRRSTRLHSYLSATSG